MAARGTDDFWKNQWVQGNTGWHRSTVDDILKSHISFLHGSTTLPDGVGTVFVPLCGKSVDMVWLEEQGFKVIGCELSELAIEQFYQENSIPYDKRSIDSFTVFSAQSRNIHLYAGSIYDLTPSVLGHSVDCVWDSRALVAINPPDRVKYAETLLALLRPGGRILMDTFEYDQSLRSSFPLSVPELLVKSLFKEERHCTIELAVKIDLKGTVFTTKFNLPWGNRLVFHIEKLC